MFIVHKEMSFDYSNYQTIPKKYLVKVLLRKGWQMFWWISSIKGHISVLMDISQLI